MKNSRVGHKDSQTVFWWVGWIVLTLASFFLAQAFWTPVIAGRFGSIRETRTAVLWVVAVFGTWMVFLVPLIIVMYQKVDKAYEDARIRREKNLRAFRSLFVDRSKRLIPAPFTARLKNTPPTLEDGHLVSVVLKDGRKIPYVFISGAEEILGIYDFTEMSFEGSDVADIELVDWTHPPAFLTSNWLRVDGVKVFEE